MMIARTAECGVRWKRTLRRGGSAQPGKEIPRKMHEAQDARSLESRMRHVASANQIKTFNNIYTLIAARGRERDGRDLFRLSSHYYYFTTPACDGDGPFVGQQSFH